MTNKIILEISDVRTVTHADDVTEIETPYILMPAHVADETAMGTYDIDSQICQALFNKQHLQYIAKYEGSFYLCSIALSSQRVFINFMAKLENTGNGEYRITRKLARQF